MQLSLPDMEIQNKYVDVYNAMLSNQLSYESGLEDLNLVENSKFDSTIFH